MSLNVGWRMTEKEVIEKGGGDKKEYGGNEKRDKQYVGVWKNGRPDTNGD